MTGRGREVRRRDVLGLIATTVLAPLASRVAARRLSRIGLHMGSLRQAARANLLGTLQTIKSIGYTEVELWTFEDEGIDALELRRALDLASLTAPSRHVRMPDVFSNARRLLTESRALGTRHLVCEQIPAQERATLDGYRRVADLLNAAGRITQSVGVQLALRPHADDFKPRDRSVPYDVLLRSTDAARVKLQMDLSLMARVHRDPIADFARYPGRFVSLHVNDVDETPAQQPVGLGEGGIDLARVVAGAVRAGVEHYFVDDDRSDAPGGHAKTNYAYLASLEFE